MASHSEGQRVAEKQRKSPPWKKRTLGTEVQVRGAGGTETRRNIYIDIQWDTHADVNRNTLIIYKDNIQRQKYIYANTDV